MTTDATAKFERFYRAYTDNWPTLPGADNQQLRFWAELIAAMDERLIARTIAIAAEIWGGVIRTAGPPRSVVRMAYERAEREVRTRFPEAPVPEAECPLCDRGLMWFVVRVDGRTREPSLNWRDGPLAIAFVPCKCSEGARRLRDPDGETRALIEAAYRQRTVELEMLRRQMPCGSRSRVAQRIVEVARRALRDPEFDLEPFVGAREAAEAVIRRSRHIDDMESSRAPEFLDPSSVGAFLDSEGPF